MSIKAVASDALVQVRNTVESSYEWLGRAVFWIKDTVISWDVPAHLSAIWNFITQALGQAFGWVATNLTYYGGQAWGMGTKFVSWSLTKTHATREVVVREGSRVLSYSSQQLSNASDMTCAFIATNVGMATCAVTLAVGLFFTANHYIDKENKALTLTAQVATAALLISGGYLFGAPAVLV